MTSYFYLTSLLVALASLMLIDRRYKLALWHDASRSLMTIGAGVVVFTVWDLLGINRGIFFHGNSQYALPFRLLPDFPIEEIFFLILLCYLTLLLYRWFETKSREVC